MNFLSLTLLCAASALWALPVYTMRPIADTYSYGIAINDSGDALTILGGWSTAVYADGRQEPVGFAAYGINNSGLISGYLPGTPAYTQAEKSGGEIRLLETPPNRWFVVNANNDQGSTVGTHHPVLVQDHAFLRDADGFHYLTDAGYRGSFAYDLNEANLVVGSVYDNVRQSPAWWDAQRQLHVIEATGLDWGYVTSVNNHGTMVGLYQKPDGTPWAFQYKDGVFTDLGIPMPWSGTLHSININDRDEIVVNSVDPLTGNQRPYYWRNGEMTALPTFPYGQGYSIATGINNRGQIIGYSLDWSIYNPRAVIWDPVESVPEPAALATLSAGLGLLLILHRRRSGRRRK